MKKTLFAFITLVASLAVVSCQSDGGDTPVPPTTKGIAKATIGGQQVDVAWVQLWTNGPKFAVYNVGATSATEYGGYYAWGGSQDKIDDHNTDSEILSGDNDTATKLWGSNWRMPTQDEFKALLDSCDVKRVSEKDPKGYIFTGKGIYSANSLLLPAAGYWDEGSVHHFEGICYYWSSKPNGSHNANYLYVDWTEQGVRGNLRNLCYPVRAVLK